MSINIVKDVLQRVIKSKEKEVEKIEHTLNYNPFIEICLLNEDIKKLFDENKTIEQRINISFIKKLNKMIKRRDELYKIAKKLNGENSNRLINKEVKLRAELHQLRGALFRS